MVKMGGPGGQSKTSATSDSATFEKAFPRPDLQTPVAVYEATAGPR